MLKHKITFLILIVLLGAVGSVQATGVSYQITVNTTSVSGTSGSLDFQFDPGFLVSQAANLQIQNFASDGTLGSPSLAGDVTGTLPATIAFDNGGVFNDYFSGFTYGSSLSFVVNFFGPAVTSPDGVSTSGSTFTFSMFSDPNGANPVLTSDPNGFAFTTDINLDGSTTPTNNSMQLTASPVGTMATPEPATLLLLASGLAGIGLFRKRAVTTPIL